MTVVEDLLPWHDLLEVQPPDAVSLVVLHCTEQPTLQAAREEALAAWEREQGTSVAAHYYVDRDGTTYRYVEDDRVTHHVFGYNHRAIGVELVNDGRYPHWFRSDHQDPTDPYTRPQLEAVAALVTDLAERHAGIRRIARHADLDRRMVRAHDDPTRWVRRRIDPGPQFPWEWLLAHWDALQTEQRP